MSAWDYLDEAVLNLFKELARFSKVSIILFLFLIIRTYKFFLKEKNLPVSSNSVFFCYVWARFHILYYNNNPRFDSYPSKESERQHKAFIADIIFYARYFYDSLDTIENYFGYSFSRLRLSSFLASNWSFDYTRRQVQIVSKPIIYLIWVFYGPFFPNPFTVIFCIYYVRLFLFFILIIIFYRDRS